MVLALAIMLIASTFASTDLVFADKDKIEHGEKDKRKHKQIRLLDLGVLQLAAHDLFNVDRDIEVDFENGKLDLSTLLIDTKTGINFEDEDIAQGGEVRNRENKWKYNLFFSAKKSFKNKIRNITADGWVFITFSRLMVIFL